VETPDLVLLITHNSDHPKKTKAAKRPSSKCAGVLRLFKGTPKTNAFRLVHRLGGTAEQAVGLLVHNQDKVGNRIGERQADADDITINAVRCPQRLIDFLRPKRKRNHYFIPAKKQESLEG